MHPVSWLIYPFRARACRMLEMLRFFRDVANVQIFQMLQRLRTFSVADVAVLSRCCRAAVPSTIAILHGSLKMLLEFCRVPFWGKLQMLQEKCVCKCCRACICCSTFNVVEFVVALKLLQVLRSFRSVVSVQGFSGCCNMKSLILFSGMSFELRRLTPGSLSI